MARRTTASLGGRLGLLLPPLPARQRCRVADRRPPRARCRRVKSGQGSGTIGQLTGGLVTRTAYYEHCALMALVPLMNPALWPGQSWPEFAPLPPPPPQQQQPKGAAGAP